MANNLFANPMVITGSMATSYKTQMAAAGKIGTLFTLIVEKILWLNPQTAGDMVNIGDPNSGLTLLQLRCENANQSQVIDWTANPKLWQDFEIDTFGSGTLFVYTR
jgi:hypothetical protein